MNKKLILQLSLFGLIMAISTVYWIPAKIEPLFWLPIFVTCAYIIAKKCSGNYFLHGFLVSLVNCVWITSAHIFLFNAYVGHHMQEIMETSEKMPDMNPKLLMLIFGPIIGIVSGLVLGLFSFIASKLIKKEVKEK